ncbi:MAG: DNA polymerase sliding clamp, partial [Candidatus Thermoplasmatota archaeon]|nr:DNA polymerase sliding clamp [Candidatus Thermoplasmatota archaeon]
MSFRAVCKADVVKSVIDSLSTLVDEAKFEISAEGLTVRAVDAAHVAMVDLRLSKGAFKNFEAEDRELGLDIDKLKDTMRLAGADDEVEFEIEEEGRMTVRFGNLVRRMSLVDTSGMTDPKVPDLNLPAVITLPAGELDRGIKAAEGISDHVALQATEDGFELSASGDMDSVDLTLTEEVLQEITVEEDVRSLYSLDYFSNMVK